MNPTPKQASEYQGGFFMQGVPPAYRQAGSAGQMIIFQTSIIPEASLGVFGEIIITKALLPLLLYWAFRLLLWRL